MIIKRLDITFKTSSIISFYNVSFFQFHEGKFMVTDNDADFRYDISDVLNLHIKQLAKEEPSLDLPFEKV